MRKFRLKIGIDVDDVLFECNRYAVELVNQQHLVDPPLKLEEIISWGDVSDRVAKAHSFYNDPNFYETQPVMDGAKEFIHELSNMADVYFATAVYPQFMGIRARRLMETFPEIPSDHIIMGSCKDLMNFDIILDDAPHNIMNSQAAYPVLMRRPWSQHLSGLYAVNNYGEFLAFVKNVMDSYSLPASKKNSNHKVYALVGPSGSGKSAIMDHFIQDGYASKHISYTTRKPRDGEENGQDYYFINKEDFLKMESNHEFFETTRYAGECYGSKLSDIETLLKSQDVVMAIDICGAMALLREFPDRAVLVFIKRPKKDLVKSILRRNCSDDEKTTRILSLDDESRNEELCHYTILNDGTIQEAEEQLIQIQNN